jgi:hypothetical protein
MVTHDAALGNLSLRDEAVGPALIEACAIVVLLGRNANVYPPCGTPRMIVSLTPIESARAIHLRWRQSGQSPELARPGAWITIPDGVVATPGYWRPPRRARWVDGPGGHPRADPAPAGGSGARVNS